MRCFRFVFLFFLSLSFFYFFTFYCSADNNIFSLDYVSDLYVSGPFVDGRGYYLQGDNRNRVYYVPMDYVNSSDFYLNISDDTNFGIYNRVTIDGIGLSNSVPVLQTFFDSYTSISDYSFYTADTFNLTDLISGYYNADYDYLVLSVTSATRDYSIAYNYVNFYRESAVVEPSPSPVPSPSPGGGFSDEHIVVGGDGNVMHPETMYNFQMSFLPDSITTLDAPVGNYDMVALYKIRVPLYVNMGDFEGRLWGSTQFFIDAVDYHLVSFPSNSTVLYRSSFKWVESESPDVTFTTDNSYDFRVIYYTDHYLSPQFFLCWDVSVYLSSGTYYSNALAEQLLVDFNNFSFTSRFVKVSDYSSSGVLGEINQGIKDTNDTLDDQFQQEVDMGNQASSDASVMVDTLSTDIKSKWEILWYPITFTSELLDVFVNGTSGSSTYSSRYANVVGYSYDDDTGMLLPVRSYTRDTTVSGAVITFPAYTLPVLNVQLWDSYTFDLSFLRQDFSELFAVSDVIITALEVLWLIAFLRDKYLEVFSK